LASKAHAQFGIVGGITSSTTELNTSEDVKSISLYHAGLTYKVDLGGGLAIQPSVLYQVKGACLGELNTASSEDFKVKTGYVEVPLSVQWGPDLMVFRPFVMVEPFIGYQVTSSDRGADSVEGMGRTGQEQVRIRLRRGRRSGTRRQHPAVGPVVQQHGQHDEGRFRFSLRVFRQGQELQGNQVFFSHSVLLTHKLKDV
jgi:hypothetical protein